MEDIPYPYYNQIYVLDHFYLRHNIPMVNDNPINQLEVSLKNLSYKMFMEFFFLIENL